MENHGKESADIEATTSNVLHIGRIMLVATIAHLMHVGYLVSSEMPNIFRFLWDTTSFTMFIVVACFAYIGTALTIVAILGCLFSNSKG
jgi:hypothetical protein